MLGVRYETLQDRSNTPDQDQCHDYKIKTKTGVVSNHSLRVHAPLMWLAGVEGIDGIK